jgi:hypothetical protein
MNPARGYAMLNFIHWLALHHPELHRLSDLPEETLLELVNEFERGKVATNPILREQWRVSFHFLLTTGFDEEGFDEARQALEQLGAR